MKNYTNASINYGLAYMMLGVFFGVSYFLGFTHLNLWRYIASFTGLAVTFTAFYTSISEADNKKFFNHKTTIK